MKFLKISSLLLCGVVGLTSCHSVEDFSNTATGNFDALWTIMDEHYCFFEEKGVNWDEMYVKYYDKLKDREQMTVFEFFDICADMLAELRDGHTNLSAPFNTSYYRAWWSDYPQNFDARLIEENYFDFKYSQVAGIIYGILPDTNIAYMRYGSFANNIGQTNLDYIFYTFRDCDALIIDVRDNGGGYMQNVGTLVSRFITERITGGYICHKTGPRHNDFSKPFAYYYDPVGGGREIWTKPVAVLTNRSTFSAANDFVSVMKYLPQVSLVGATTGGGSGMPFTSELPIGWAVRFSASPVYDREMRLTENGIEPSEGCAVDMDPVDALNGRDTILDFAVNRLGAGVSTND